MGELKVIKKDGATNPLKKSPLLGATLAMAGINNTLILHHGCQGCTALTKNLLTAHFNEVIPVSTTASSDIATIMGGNNIEEAINNILKNKNPDLIAILSTTLVETRGDDIFGELKTIENKLSLTCPIIYINCADFIGDGEVGFSRAILELVANVSHEKTSKTKNINILTNFSMTCGDLLELKEILNDFELDYTILPDISSLSGSCNDYPGLIKGSTTLDDIRSLVNSEVNICIGTSMLKVAEYLKENFNIPYYFLPSITGIKHSDTFFTLLEEISGKKRKDKYKLERNILIDSMLDCHFYLTNKYISMAIEPDLLYALSYFLVEEMGAKLEAAVTTNSSDIAEEIPTNNIYIGDFEDFLDEIKHSELIISNFYGLLVSKKKDIPIYFAGFPIKNRLGYHLKSFIGYRGTRDFLFDIANIFLDIEEEESSIKII